MARKTTIELVDDLTGSKADETITFGVDGVEYEIDLSTENAEKIREQLTGWAEKARRIGGRARRGSAAPAGSNDAKKIREWARENGFEVPERGRIPSEIREAYETGTPKAASDEAVSDEAVSDETVEKPSDENSDKSSKKAKNDTPEEETE